MAAICVLTSHDSHDQGPNRDNLHGGVVLILWNPRIIGPKWIMTCNLGLAVANHPSDRSWKHRSESSLTAQGSGLISGSTCQEQWDIITICMVCICVYK